MAGPAVGAVVVTAVAAWVMTMARPNDGPGGDRHPHIVNA
jgi:hypothetical protein